jgi:hypothetical protein
MVPFAAQETQAIGQEQADEAAAEQTKRAALLSACPR